MTRKNLMNGAIVAVVISIILIYYGGQPGTIGGVVGILGAIVAAAKPYLPWSQNTEARAASTSAHAAPTHAVSPSIPPSPTAVSDGAEVLERTCRRGHPGSAGAEPG